MHTIAPQFFNRSTVIVAQELLGKRLVREYHGKRLSGIIIETEAYQSDDPACHAYNKQCTARTKALFGPVGHSYVYFTYGNHYCLNIVSRDPNMPSQPSPSNSKVNRETGNASAGAAGGVLIRALFPEEGIEEMKKARQKDAIHQLTSGPGKLTQALHITREQEHIDITKRGQLYIEEGIEIVPDDIVATPRIGISRATEKLWRFVLKS